MIRILFLISFNNKEAEKENHENQGLSIMTLTKNDFILFLNLSIFIDIDTHFSRIVVLV